MMDSLPDSVKDALRHYRAHAALSTEAKGSLRERIGDSIAAGEAARVDARLRALEQPPLDARQIAVRIAIPVAIAAAVLLALRAVVGPSTTIAEGGAERGKEEAAYGAGVASDRTARAGRPAEAVSAPPPGQANQVEQETPAAPEAPTEESVPLDTPTPAPKGKTAARAKPAPSPTDTTLAAEMESLRRARGALRRGDPDAALTELDAYATRFAEGQMREDGEALRVQALCDAGRDADARSAAAVFARKHPGSPHVARVQKICAER